ncbi:helix-turn-helix domain-containing protein [Natrialba sp. INN-245]|uniref:helix-turn-helix domain-containing protein n=1 Tax=Natrialba sp. INN-245 TaxID=2690967 RepID=UPI001310E042|nr:helix-turn-helix domain-containing protein [Natrialba sp. INN-245]MWV40789.1 helix-turn-helix domain-containing protein [Natrialba sp. INN-245]
MARLFPFRSETTARDGTPRVVDLEGEDADAVFSALSSTTARQIYARLDEEPGTPSDVADAIDSSIQNVRYHLENLEDAGLIEVVDTWYSSRGNEMSVYGTTDGPLIVTSDESTASQLKTAISRLIGGIGALAAGSLLVQYGVSQWFAPTAPGTEEATPAEGNGIAATDGEEDAVDGDAPVEEAPDDSAESEPQDDEMGSAAVDDEADAADRDAEESPEATETPEDDSPETFEGDESEDAETDVQTDDEPVAEYDGEAEPTADDGTYLVDGGAEATDAVVGTVPPGLLFFLGGLVVLLAITAYWYWSQPSY